MSLEEDLAALTTTATIPGTTRPAAPNTPRGWEPGVKYDPAGPMLVTTVASDQNVQGDPAAWKQMVEELGLGIPDGWQVRLVEAKYDPVAWTRETPEQDKATTRPVWRYRFVVEPAPLDAIRSDLDSLIRDAMRRKRRARAEAPEVLERGQIVIFADPQIGKVGSGGGFAELAARIADSFDRLDDHQRDLRKIGRACASAFWLDAGDGLENFNNVRSQAYTNDLSMTEQVRAYRRTTFEGLDRLAGRYGKVTAAVCVSNHSQVRVGKDPVGPNINDWGVEVLAQVQDAYSRNPDRYGHVDFAYPTRWRNSLALDVCGTTVGLAHGHDAPNADKIPLWWRGQAFGNEPVGSARILVTGHYHHMRAQQLGDGKLWLQATTLDNQSDWYAGLSGEKSVPGLMVVSITKHGWDDLRIL